MWRWWESISGMWWIFCSSSIQVWSKNAGWAEALFMTHYRRPIQGVRFTNSRTIFLVFTNSRTTEEKRVSRFYERDFVHSRTTNHESVEIHEFTNKFFNFHEFTNKFFNFHEFPNDFSHFHEFPNEKKNNSRLPERRWRGLLNSHFSVS